MKTLKHFSYRHIHAFIASNVFFFIVLALFAAGASWVALASLYPMAFDEEFHVGLIHVYATSWIPYGIEHTGDMARLGAATADASYLMHYVLSFPYRILQAFSLSKDAIVILLRLLNVAMFVGALMIFRRGLLEAGVSRAISHVALAFVTLIPIAPVLAGQVNYDNPLMVIVAILFLLTIRITNTLTRAKKIHAIDFWLFVITALIGLNIKFASAAIILAFVAWLLLTACVQFKKSIFSPVTGLFQSTKSLTRRTQIFLTAGLILSVFFSAHYMTNLVQYGSLTPTCDDVFSEKDCLQYGPWRRNFELKATRPDDFKPLSFTGYLTQYWIPDMGERLTFAVAGITNDYQTKEPLEFMYVLFMTMSIVATIILFISAFILKIPLTWITLLASGLYIVPLAVRLYGSYVTHAEPIAINGRYLLPVLPLILGVALSTVALVSRKLKLSTYLPHAAMLLLIMFVLAGGGIGTYVILAEPAWFFNGWGQQSHQVLQHVFGLFIIR